MGGTVLNMDTEANEFLSKEQEADVNYTESNVIVGRKQEKNEEIEHQ